MHKKLFSFKQISIICLNETKILLDELVKTRYDYDQIEMHSNKFVYNLINSLIISDMLVIYKTDIYQMQCMYFVGTVDRLPLRWYTLITDLVVISEVLHSVLQDGLHTIYLKSIWR